MRRALLLFNPEAAGVSPRVRDVIAHALSSELKLDVAETKRRHHATHLAAGAAHEGFEAVVVLGGDGTLNEVVNGLAFTGVPVIPIPGGGTNVFARTLGLPKDPIEATSVLIEHLKAGAQPRSINLGRVNGRAFAFCAGVGTIGTIVRRIERRSRMKKTLGQTFFVAQAVKSFVTASRRKPPLTLVTDASVPAARGSDGEGRYENLHEVVVCNSDPFTFLGEHAFRLCPEASLEEGLDVLALRSVGTPFLLRIVASGFRSQRHVRFRHISALHDLDRFTIEASRPVALQLDGDDAGDHTVFEFENLRDALSVIV